MMHKKNFKNDLIISQLHNINKYYIYVKQKKKFFFQNLNLLPAAAKTNLHK